MNSIIRIILAVFTILTFSLSVNADSRTSTNKKMSIDKVIIEIPVLKAQLVLSNPAYLADTVDETPYQLLQVCNEQRHCKTLLDVRGGDGVSVTSDTSLSFSPDHLYLIVLRMAGVDVMTKTYKKHYYEIYGIVEGAVVGFQTKEGKNATTDNILQWSHQYPHALEISVGRKKRALAYRK